MSGKATSTADGGQVLQAQAAAGLSTGQFAKKLARLDPPIPASGKPLTGERVRQLCADEGMDGCELQSNGRWHITDPDAAVRWCRRRGIGTAGHGGRRGDEPVAVGPGAADARADLTGWQAKRARLDYERELGRLLPADDVEQSLAAFLSALRLRYERLGSRIMRVVDARVPDLAPEVRRLLAADVDDQVHQSVGAVIEDPLGHGLDVGGDDETEDQA